jgi:cyclopropane-fatty-acyl-phospholipid synthase
VLCKTAESVTDFELVEVEDLSPHYPATLRAWRNNLLENAGAIRARGYSDALIRTWEYYLAYCEAGFSERHIRDVQLVLERSR